MSFFYLSTVCAHSVRVQYARLKPGCFGKPADVWKAKKKIIQKFTDATRHMCVCVYQTAFNEYPVQFYYTFSIVPYISGHGPTSYHLEYEQSARTLYRLKNIQHESNA